MPASLQLIGPSGSEELLLAAGLVLEAAAGS
jgi:Asp-tRNA(Asn)/Glu-tRNA(Gln) amidotransferase A subunit family amidase